MTRPSVWNRWILLTVWVIQTPMLWLNVTRPITQLMINYELLSSWIYLVPYLAYILCLALQVWEIIFFRRQSLNIWFYLFSHIFKCLVYSLSVAEALWFWKFRWHEFPAWAHWDLAERVVHVLTLYIGLGYAIYIFVSYRKSRKVISDNTYKAYSWSARSLDEKHTAFLLPAKINSASNIIVDVHWLIELTQWVFSHPNKAGTTSRSLTTMIGFGARYIVGSVYGVLVLPTATTLPGRPQDPYKPDRSRDWDYIKPNLTMDDFQDNLAEASDPRTMQDEESRIDVVRLHRLPPERGTPVPVRDDLRENELVATARLLRPRYLCFLTDTADDTSSPKYTVRKVDEWLAEHSFRGNPDYVFISYTRRQFYTQRIFDQKTPHSKLNKLQLASERDRASLADHAVKAARHAGISAFWVDFECVRPEDNMKEGSDMEDVYRICDIVRAAHSLSIVVGPSLDKSYEHVVQDASHKDEWILEWGMRMWTVPEALLCPSEHRVAVYTIGTTQPELVAKRNLAGRVWEDADDLRQLIDHYEGSLHLTQLELISIALECLSKRQTDPRNAGDVAYVLMGLLRLRPKVNKSDSDFQAFARLSLANDSNKILERIMCLQPPNHNGNDSPWHNMRDTWAAKLWDFDPLYQVSDIGSNNTVIIGDACGTTIDWTSLKQIDYSVARNRFKKRWTFITAAATMLPVFLGLYCVVSILIAPLAVVLAQNRHGDPQAIKDFYARYFQILFAIIWGIAALVGIFLPAWLHAQFQSGLAKTEARLFGMQGRPDLERVEALMLGAASGRLKWSADSDGDSNSDDSTGAEGQRKTLFTLIDTLTCTAFTFHAEKPPTLAFIGARERGGLLRTPLCSYDHVARAFVKEAVIRLDGAALQRVSRLDAFRFAVATIKYTDEIDLGNSQVANDEDDDDDVIEIPDVPEFRCLPRPDAS